MTVKNQQVGQAHKGVRGLNWLLAAILALSIGVPLTAGTLLRWWG
jgi:hypothetical protein